MFAFATQAPDTSRVFDIRTFLAGASLPRAGALAAFEHQFKKDALGHRIHTWIAMLTLAAICSRTAVAEFAIIPLAAYSLIRVLNVWRCWIYAALSPVGILMLGLGAWAWLSLLWTRDLTQGLDEVYNTRWVLLPGMLWPVLDQRRKLIGAIVVGMLLANLSQVWHAIGVHFDIDFMRFPRMPDRNSGWWEPVVGGFDADRRPRPAPARGCHGHGDARACSARRGRSSRWSRSSPQAHAARCSRASDSSRSCAPSRSYAWHAPGG
jgi:hypothetical protein